MPEQVEPFSILYGKNINYGDQNNISGSEGNFITSNATACGNECDKNASCKGFVFVNNAASRVNNCWLKKVRPDDATANRNYAFNSDSYVKATEADAAKLIKSDSIDNPYHRDYINPNSTAVRVNDIGELYDRQTAVAYITMTACITAIIAAIVIGGNK